MAARKPKKVAKLATGRPPGARKSRPTLSAQTTRTTIRAFHQLNKSLQTAQAAGNHAEAAEFQKRIDDLGGLKIYQQASIQGQANERGGDSSVVLMQWLESGKNNLTASEAKRSMLEVGALSTKNACSKSNLFDITRIDLNSQSEGILEQDFMQRPLPSADSERFDIISLSLVVNFVPDAEGRGEMLRRSCNFLRASTMPNTHDGAETVFPALFLVLPAPCILNSRYFNSERLTLLMASLGYVLLQRKQTAKLVYYLWQLRDKPLSTEPYFPKVKLHDGGGRNNFCIVLR